MNRTCLKTILSCLTVLLTVGELSAQEPIRLGYCDTETDRAMYASDEEPAEFGAAILLPAKMLKKYAGDKINRIDFAIGEKVGRMMTVFVTRELGEEPIVKKTIYNFEKGWNTVALPSEVAIKGTEDLYVGYVFNTDKNTIHASVIMYDKYKGATPGVNWYSKNNKWWAVPSNVINYDLCIRAYADGDNRPTNDVGIRDLENYDIVMQNQATNFSMRMRNYGVDSVDNVTIEIKANDEVFATKTLSDLTLGHNDEMEVKVDNVLFPTEGNNTIKVEVIKVNSGVDTDKSDNKLQNAIYAIKEGAQPCERRILFEEFTSEIDPLATTADTLYGDAVATRDDVIWVKHHIDVDKFVLDEEKPYKFLFDNEKMFYPAVMVDRQIFNGMEDAGPAYFVPYGDVVEGMLKNCSYIPSYIAPSIAISHAENGGTVNFTVSGTAEVREMPFQKSLRLTVYAVEDSIVTTTQAGVPEFKQNGVIRKILSSSCWGDEIDISSYSFKKDYSLEIAPEWNVSNMRIVAFVNNYDDYKKENCTVYNTVQTPIYTAGIEAVNTADNGKDVPRVWYVGNQLQVENGYSLIGVYDLSGKNVNEYNLVPGMYIVKVSDGKNIHNLKYIVKK